jgi:hypothetical protein
VYFSAKAFPAMVGAENANSSIPRTYPCKKLDLKWNKKMQNNPFSKIDKYIEAPCHILYNKHL